MFKPFHSYTTFGVDLALDKIFDQILQGRTGLYVDIGAWKPDEYSNTYLLYEKGWTGLCIDPNPEMAELHKAVRPRDTFFQGGAGNKRMADFTMYDYSMANSLTHSVENEKLGFKPIEVIQVEVKPLSELLEEMPPVNLFSIDTEGSDIEILDSNNWNIQRPEIIVIEDYSFANKKKDKNIEKYMNNKGYFKMFDYYSDSIFGEWDLYKQHFQ